MRYLAVCNPAAGGGRCGRRAAEAVGRLREAGLEIDVVETTVAGEGIELTRKAWAEGRRHFIAVGGDGTSYELVNGLFPEAWESGETPVLGFLPLGTGNSFLRDFTEEGEAFAFEALKEQREHPCDVIRLECVEGTLHYINICSIGFTADVGGLTNRRFKGLGDRGYHLATILEVARLRPHALPMVMDGVHEAEPCTFISINNSRFTGGRMLMAPHAEVADGRAAVVIVGKMGRITLLRTFPKIFTGEHVNHPAVRITHAKQIDFSLERPCDIMIDGEIVHMTPKQLTVLPSALKVRV